MLPSPIILINLSVGIIFWNLTATSRGRNAVLISWVKNTVEIIDVDCSETDLNLEKSANFFIRDLTIILTIVIKNDPPNAMICGMKTSKDI